MMPPIKWKLVARVEVHLIDKKMQQTVDVKLGEDGIYYAALVDCVWEYVGIIPTTNIKDAVTKAYDLAEMFLARRAQEADEEAAQRKAQAEKDREPKVIEKRNK